MRVYEALTLGKRLIPIYLMGHGYSHKDAALHLKHLASTLSAPRLEELYALLDDKRDDSSQQQPVTIEDVQVLLAKALPQIITVDWKPDASQNALEAAVANVMRRLDMSRIDTGHQVPLKRTEAASASSPVVIIRALTNLVFKRRKPADRYSPRVMPEQLSPTDTGASDVSSTPDSSPPSTATGVDTRTLR